MNDNLLPHEIEAEECVLGSILLDPEVLPQVCAKIKPQDFYRERNGWIFQACIKTGEATDQITVASELVNISRLEDIGGPAYLSYLVSRTPTPFLAPEYADMIRRSSLRRRLIEAGGKIAGFGYAEAWPDEALAKSKDLLDNLMIASEHKGFRHVSVSLNEKATQTVRVKTGFKCLDEAFLGGIPKGTLTVIAGETTVGKTAFSLSACRNAAAAGHSVGIVTLEMSERDLVKRLLYSDARVDSYNLRQEDYSKLERAKERLSEMGIWIYDPSGDSFDEIRSKVVAHSLREGLDLVLYDYIGLEAGVEAANEVLRRSAVVRKLRALAKEIDTAVLAITPLSRATDPHKRKLSRLAWSAELEYHPDAIGFLEQVIDGAGKPVPDKLTLDIQKQRTGRSPFTVALHFDKATQRIWEEMK